MLSQIKSFLISLRGFIRRRDPALVETIRPEDGLLRRAPLFLPNYIKPDNSISSLAFKPRKTDKDGLSVDLERLTTHQAAILDRLKFRLARLAAAVPLSIGLTCIHSPTDDNRAHSLIQGNFTKAVCRQLAAAAQLLSLQ